LYDGSPHIKDIQPFGGLRGPIYNASLQTSKQRQNLKNFYVKVKLSVNDLKSENAIYQFAATAPGTYQVMDVGRFVRDFKALDAQGNALKTERLSTNQWKIHKVERAREISYDRIVDSPFLLGQLTRAEMDVKGSAVEIYVYSKSGRIKAEQVLASAKEVLLAAAAFTKALPVKCYTFLFHFEDGNKGALGAWEHSYSSLYTFNDAAFEQMLQQDIAGIMAHEFFHIVTPLNIHSEIIEQFNFDAKAGLARR